MPAVLLARSGDSVRFSATAPQDGTSLVREFHDRTLGRMKLLYTRRLTLLPVDARNARDLWRMLNAPDLRKYQDIPRIPAEDFERQVRSRPRALDGRSTGRFEWLLQTGARPGARDRLDLVARQRSHARTSARSATV